MVRIAATACVDDGEIGAADAALELADNDQGKMPGTRMTRRCEVRLWNGFQNNAAK